MIKQSAIVIGGLILNQQPLSEIINIFQDTTFIDINNFSLEEIEQQIIRILNSAIVTPVLIGYSTGGLIALKILPQIQNLIHKLILINSTPCFMQQANWHGITQANFDKLRMKLNTLSLANFKDHFCCLSLFPHTLSSDERSTLLSEASNTAKIYNWLQVISTLDIREFIPKIDTPTLMIYSQLDHLVSNKNEFSNSQITTHTLQNSTHAKLNKSELIEIIMGFIA